MDFYRIVRSNLIHTLTNTIQYIDYIILTESTYKRISYKQPKPITILLNPAVFDQCTSSRHTAAHLLTGNPSINIWWYNKYTRGNNSSRMRFVSVCFLTKSCGNAQPMFRQWLLAQTFRLQCEYKLNILNIWMVRSFWLFMEIRMNIRS